MNPLTFKGIILLSIVPIVVAGGLLSSLLFGPGSSNTACKGHGVTGNASTPACSSTSVEPDVPSLGRNLRKDADRIPLAEDTSRAVQQYSERRIQILNTLKPMPETDAQLAESIEKLTVQQQRFERRYGAASVAARSVRARLRDLREHASSGLRYAAHDEQQSVVD